MNNKQTNIGVQIMPLVLVAASFGFYITLNIIMMVACFILAVAMWLVLYSESVKNPKN